MLVSRILSRTVRRVYRSSLLLLASQSEKLRPLPIISTQFHTLVYKNSREFARTQVSPSSQSAFNMLLVQRFGISSSASPEATEKDHKSTIKSHGDSANTESPKNGNTEVSEKIEDSTSTQPEVAELETESDAESDDDELSIDDLVNVVAEKEELLKSKHKEIEKMQDKVLRSYAEMENVMERTKREAENSKKFAIQNFAKSLLDVADNLGRASSVVKDSFSKIDTTKDVTGAVQLLKTLLEGVEMTEKHLMEVFKKFGVEKFDPTNEPFDPHRHHAVYQIPDASKPPGTVAAVLKSGYMLHERVLRPAEVGVTQTVDSEASNNNNASDN